MKVEALTEEKKVKKNFTDLQNLLMERVWKREGVNPERFELWAREELVREQFERAMEMRKKGQKPIFIMDYESVLLCTED
ncbi:MAG: hypothetical protein HYV41_03890 [Candidatus Magasanikbacteria bacterium]|nr:hypothetical protein [Candidatus Magasanikbacteria bacterium]